MAESYVAIWPSGLVAQPWLKNKRGGRIYRKGKKYIPEGSMALRLDSPPSKTGP
jgi:hypothetical protein